MMEDSPRQDGKPILNLPARLVQVVKCDFDAEERAFYEALEKKTSLTFNKVSCRSLKRVLTGIVPQIRLGNDELHLGFDNATKNATRSVEYLK
jgi:hypothetical protein